MPQYSSTIVSRKNCTPSLFCMSLDSNVSVHFWLRNVFIAQKTKLLWPEADARSNSREVQEIFLKRKFKHQSTERLIELEVQQNPGLLFITLIVLLESQILVVKHYFNSLPMTRDSTFIESNSNS